MKTSQSFGVHFTIKKEKAKDGVTNVYVSVTINKERIHFALKHYVKVDNWDKGRGGLKIKVPEAKETNAYLEQVKFTITTYYQQLQIAGKEVTPQLLKAMFLGEETEQTYSLSKLMDYHYETASAALTWSTLKHYAVTRRYLEKFLKEKRNTSDIRINDIDYKFIIDFETYLRNHKPKDHQRPMNNNGVMKHLIRLRKMTTLALKLTWISRDPFKNYKFRYKKVETAFLNQKELDSIKVKDFAIDRLNIVRDLFVFSCYTGLSYVDLMNLKENNITAGEDGANWIKLFRQKSNEPTNIPILPVAQQILERYRHGDRAEITGTLFPNLSNQKVNSYLKEIGFMNGIKKVLTFGVARHTFATTVTLSNNVPIETVSKMMGHTKIATTQIYARVLLKKIGDDMSMLREKLEPEFNQRPVRKRSSDIVKKVK
ncbi:site-specific integrase [Mucilaginibacter myungsuensis]|uniref:Site-specific integrase n=1 Tax=Mucilaginibacter myungsuensis TaxID=649104 RepID=A0A929L357_9SPHI|nr:site-specific integrase [Mucilaginibacter myungsuensis]MBE9663210.1 site-specific integrase [Mucilaginibacter myungsuensis]MDN3598843.1 site-specific integrase [Mucilaginibacter myungsuensis]